MNENAGETVILRFRTEDNDRALSGLREVIDSSKYVWYYTAEKADNTPATGTKTVQTMIGNDGKITNQVAEPFSLGLWNFTLYGYKDSQADANLVYKGTVSGYEIKSDSNTIDVTVEPQKPTGGKGTIKVDEKIKLTANGVDYPATEVTVKKEGTDTETKKDFDTTRADIVFDNLDVGAYTVTVAYKPGTITYATNSVTVNVWNHLTTTISGRLDEKTVYKSFSAADGVATDTKTIDTTTINTNGLTLGLSPAAAVSAETDTSAYTTTIKGDIVKTGDEDAKVKVDVYDLGAMGDGGTAAFKVEEGENAVAALDLTLENAKINNGVVIVTTFISKGLSSVKLYHSNNQMDVTPKTTENEVTADNNWFYDAATGKLVFATSSFSPFHVTSEMNVYDSDSNKSYKLEKKDGEYKLLDKDGQEATAAGANLVLLDCTLSNAVPDALLSKNWTVIHARCVDNTGFCDEESSYFSGGRGTKIEPYLVATKEQFQNISKFKAYGYYKWTGESTLDAKGWNPVYLCGSFDGNGLKITNLDSFLFRAVWNGSDSWAPGEDTTNTYTIENLDITADIRMNAGWASTVVRTVGVDTFVMKNVDVHGYIEGTIVAAFVCFGPGNFDSSYQYDGHITFEDCHSDMTVVATSEGAVGFIAHAMMKSSAGEIVLKKSDFTGTLYATAPNSGTNFKYVCGNWINATITDDRETGSEALYDKTVNGWKYTASGKTNVLTAENKKITDLSVSVGDAVSVDAVENATKAVIELQISPNPGNMTSCYMKEEVSLADNKFTSSSIKYFTIRINDSNATETGVNGNYYDVVSTYFDTALGSNTVIRFAQYDTSGTILKVTNISLEDKTSN